MSDIAIRVENLSKAYRIGLREQKHDTLGAALVSWAKSPLENFRKLRKLSHFDNFDDPDVLWALKDVSFEVKQGEVLGIIGKNGAGKSTLLKLLARITEPTYGRAEIYGRVASLLEVGTGFNPELTGRENIYLNGTILGMTKKEIDRKFDEIVDFSGVEKFIDTPVKRYSSGMRVRLAFAVAAHLDPEILIIDEVLAVGDAEFQKKCLGKMEDVATKEGRTVLFVSHDMGNIQRLTDDTLYLKAGNSTGIIDTKTAIEFYLNDATDNLQSRVYYDAQNRFYFEITNIQIKPDVLFSFSSAHIIFHVYSDREWKDVGINITISSPLVNGFLFHTSNKPHNCKEISLRRGMNIIKLEIPKLLFSAGTYFLGFGIGIPMREQFFFDRQIRTFQIIEAPYPKGTISTRSNYGICLLNSNIFVQHES